MYKAVILAILYTMCIYHIETTKLFLNPRPQQNGKVFFSKLVNIEEKFPKCETYIKKQNLEDYEKVKTIRRIIYVTNK